MTDTKAHLIWQTDASPHRLLYFCIHDHEVVFLQHLLRVCRFPISVSIPVFCLLTLATSVLAVVGVFEDVVKEGIERQCWCMEPQLVGHPTSDGANSSLHFASAKGHAEELDDEVNSRIVVSLR